MVRCYLLCKSEDGSSVPSVKVSVLGGVWISGGSREVCKLCWSCDPVERLLSSPGEEWVGDGERRGVFVHAALRYIRDEKPR